MTAGNGVTPFNIIQGPAVLYVAPFPVTNLAATYLNANPASVAVNTPFLDVGGTTGGVTVEVDETLTDIHVDQLLDPVGARITARTIQVTTTLMENTLQNLQLALNGPTSGTGSTSQLNPGSGYNELDLLATSTSGTQPLYSTIIIDGWAPTVATGGSPATRRFVIQKALSQPKISQKFDMANQATVAVTWTAYYVSSSTPPFSIIDSLTGAAVES